MPIVIQPSRLQFQDYQFEVKVPAGPWKWTTRADVSHSVPTFEIRDIISPWGTMRDMIPIPGEVVEEMASSITVLQQSFAPGILFEPTALVFTVDEGRGVSASQEVVVTNNGSFGSLLSASVVSSVPYVAPTPANVSGLAFNESGKFDVAVDSANLLATGSPFSATLTLQDARANNSPQVLPVTINVRSKATISASVTELDFGGTKPVSGSFPPIPSQIFTLSNTGLPDSVLQYQIQKLIGVPWLTSFTPTFGLINGGTSQPITVVVAPDNTMLPGEFTETLRITGYSSNLQVDVAVTLLIT